MPSLYGSAGGANRKLRELYARDSGGATRKLRELWGRDAGGVGRKIFSAGAVMYDVPTEHIVPGSHFGALDAAATYYSLYSSGISLHAATNSHNVSNSAFEWAGVGTIGWCIPIDFGDAVNISKIHLQQNLSVTFQSPLISSDGDSYFGFYLRSSKSEVFTGSGAAGIKAAVPDTKQSSGSFTVPAMSVDSAWSASQLYLYVIMHTGGQKMGGSYTLAPASYSISIPNSALSVITSAGEEIPVNFR